MLDKSLSNNSGCMQWRSNSWQVDRNIKKITKLWLDTCVKIKLFGLLVSSVWANKLMFHVCMPLACARMIFKVPIRYKFNHPTFSIFSLCYMVMSDRRYYLLWMQVELRWDGTHELWSDAFWFIFQYEGDWWERAKCSWNSFCLHNFDLTAFKCDLHLC